MEVISRVERTAVRRSLHRMVRPFVLISDGLNQYDRATVILPLSIDAASIQVTPILIFALCDVHPNMVGSHNAICVNLFEMGTLLHGKCGRVQISGRSEAIRTVNVLVAVGAATGGKTYRSEQSQSTRRSHRSNENKMSDGGRDRALFAVKMWKSPRM